MPPEYEDSEVIEVPDVIQVTKKKEIRAKRLALLDRNQRARKERLSGWQLVLLTSFSSMALQDSFQDIRMMHLFIYYQTTFNYLINNSSNSLRALYKQIATLFQSNISGLNHYLVHVFYLIFQSNKGAQSINIIVLFILQVFYRYNVYFTTLDDIILYQQSSGKPKDFIIALCIPDNKYIVLLNIH